MNIFGYCDLVIGDVWTEKGFHLSPGGFWFTRRSKLGKIVSRRPRQEGSRGESPANLPRPLT